MDYASKDLCQELYEATGWKQEKWYYRDGNIWLNHVTLNHDEPLCPAYTIGYLLDKLPNFHEYWNGGNEAGYLTLKHWSRDYESGYWEENGDASHTNKLTGGYAPTAADALAKLALELKKQGII